MCLKWYYRTKMEWKRIKQDRRRKRTQQLHDQEKTVERKKGRHPKSGGDGRQEQQGLSYWQEC